MGRIGNKVKSGIRLGAKVAVVGGALLGAGFGVKQEYDGLKGDIRADNRATLMGSFGENPQITPMKAGVKVGSAGMGVQATRPAPPDQRLPPPAPPIAPFEARAKAAAKKQAVQAVAGVVSGQQSVGSAVKGVAGAVFDAGVTPPDPIAQKLSKAGRDAHAGATVVAGAEGIEASSADLMKQLKTKGKAKVKGAFNLRLAFGL